MRMVYHWSRWLWKQSPLDFALSCTNGFYKEGCEFEFIIPLRHQFLIGIWYPRKVLKDLTFHAPRHATLIFVHCSFSSTCKGPYRLDQICAQTYLNKFCLARTHISCAQVSASTNAFRRLSVSAKTFLEGVCCVCVIKIMQWSGTTNNCLVLIGEY